MRPRKRNLVLASTVAAVLAALGPPAAHAVTLPATTFTNIGVAGGTSICPAGVNALTDGICTYATPSSTSAGFAHTDGGIAETPGCDPLASPDTHVSTGATGPGVSSFATMTYYCLSFWSQASLPRSSLWPNQTSTPSARSASAMCRAASASCEA